MLGPSSATSSASRAASWPPEITRKSSEPKDPESRQESNPVRNSRHPVTAFEIHMAMKKGGIDSVTLEPLRSDEVVSAHRHQIGDQRLHLRNRPSLLTQLRRGDLSCPECRDPIDFQEPGTNQPLIRRRIKSQPTPPTPPDVDPVQWAEIVRIADESNITPESLLLAFRDT